MVSFENPFPSREVFREILMRVFAEDETEGLVGVADSVIEQLETLPGCRAEWLVHHVRSGGVCCHIQQFEDEAALNEGDPFRVWQASADSIGAALVLAIEAWVDWVRDDGLPSLGDPDA